MVANHTLYSMGIMYTLETICSNYGLLYSRKTYIEIKHTSLTFNFDKDAKFGVGCFKATGPLEKLLYDEFYLPTISGSEIIVHFKELPRIASTKKWTGPLTQQDIKNNQRIDVTGSFRFSIYNFDSLIMLIFEFFFLLSCRETNFYCLTIGPTVMLFAKHCMFERFDHIFNFILVL